MLLSTNWRVLKPTATTNYILNPSAETTGNFAALGGATVNRVTPYQKYGVYSYQVIAASQGDGISLTLKASNNSVHFFTFRIRGLLPDLRVILGSEIKEPIFIEKIDNDWSLYGCVFSSAATILYLIQQGQKAGNFYIDGLQLEPLSYWTSYCDGTQKGCEWEGTEHASASVRSGATHFGGAPKDLYLEYKFFAQRIRETEVTNLLSDSYSILPGEELSDIKIQSSNLALTGKFVADSEDELYQARQEFFEFLRFTEKFILQFLGSQAQKEIEVSYQSGLEGNLDVFYDSFSAVDESGWSNNLKFIEHDEIQLLAPQSYWTEVGESAVELDVTDTDTYRFVAGRLKSTGQWSSLGPPAVTTGPVHAIAEDNVYVYFGGNFTNFDNIAAADYIVRYHKQDATWSALGGGLNGRVRTLALAANGDLYIGGEFTNAGGIANADNLCYWDGTSFNAIGNPSAGTAAITSVWAIVFDRTGKLFIGGDFLNWAGNASSDNIVMWNGNSYSPLATGLDNGVRALAVGLDNTLYIGGVFTNLFVSWNGTSFTTIGVTGTSVLAIAVDPRNDLIYIGGVFTAAGTLSVTNLASWNKQAFSQLDGGVASTIGGWGIFSLVVGPDGILYIAGALETAGGITLPDKIVRWNGYSFVHMDINFPGSNANIQFVLPGKDEDIFSKGRYTLWVAFSTAGTGGTSAGAVTPTNEGNLKAFPKIVFERSGGSSATIETLKNELDGKEILFNYALLDGERLTLDLASPRKTITSSFFGPKPDAVLKNSDIGEWGLLPGENLITSFVLQITSPTLTAYMIWKDTYDGII